MLRTETERDALLEKHALPDVADLATPAGEAAFKAGARAFMDSQYHPFVRCTFSDARYKPLMGPHFDIF